MQILDWNFNKMEIINLNLKKVWVSKYDTFDKCWNKLNKESQYRISIFTENYKTLVLDLIYNIDYSHPDSLKKLLKRLKNVKITMEEYEERKKRDDEIRKKTLKIMIGILTIIHCTFI